MNLWLIALVLSAAGMTSSNYRVMGWSTMLFGISLLQLVVAWGLV
jgi:hypothetical protein